MHVYAHVHVSACEQLLVSGLRECLCVDVYAGVRVGVCVCVGVYVSVCVHVCVCVHVHVYTYMYV